jgi:rhodanese-related sulfurtransferase
MKSQSINKEKINSQEAIKLIQEHQADTNFIILDVRTPDEYKSGHIENSICINFESADFKENVSKLDKIKTYLVYCHGEGRSGAGIKIMKNMGFSNLILLLKGIEGWKENGFKTTTN